jgi:hypothetical protein
VTPQAKLKKLENDRNVLGISLCAFGAMFGMVAYEGHGLIGPVVIYPALGLFIYIASWPRYFHRQRALRQAILRSHRVSPSRANLRMLP